METIVGKYLNCVADYIEAGNVIEALSFGVQSAGVDFNKRIFSAKESKDIDNKGLGGYSNPYKKRRRSLGRQTAFKDLQVTNDLRNSVFKDVDNNRVVLQFDESIHTPPPYIKKDGSKGYQPKKISNRQKATNIQSYQNSKGNSNIFEYSESEVDKVFETTDSILINDFKRIANECSGLS